MRWAFVLSLCLHLIFLLAGRDLSSDWLTDDAESEVMAVRLLPPPQPAKPMPKVSKPAPRAVPVRTAPSPATPVPDAQAPVIETISDPVAVPLGAPATGVASLAARALPPSGRMRFAVSKGEQAFVVGEAVHAWAVEEDRYTLQSTMETTGLVALFASVRLSQVSSGRMTEGGLQPETFRDNRKDGQYRADFDWAAGQIELGNGSRLPLPAGAQDVLSMFYQFSLYPLDEPELSLMVTTGRKFERYVFRIEADVPLRVRGQSEEGEEGEVERVIATYHLSYRGRDAEGVEVWLARDLDRLPVKIRYVDRKGGMTELLATEVNYQGQP